MAENFGVQFDITINDNESEAKLKRIHELLKEINKDFDKTGAESKKVNTETTKTNDTLNKTASAIKKNSSATDNLSKKTNKASDSIRKFGDESKKAKDKSNGLFSGIKGLALGALGALGIGFGVQEVITQLVDADRMLKSIKGLTHSTDTEMKSLQSRILDIAGTGLASVSDLYHMAFEQSKVTHSTKDIENDMIHIANFAKATKNELVASAEAVLALKTQFAKQGYTMEQIADSSTIAIDGTLQSLNDYAEAMKYAGVASGIAGISLEDTSAVIATLAQNGIKGSVAGYAYKAMLTTLGTATKQTRSGLSRLGLNMDKINIKKLGMAKVIQNLAQSVGKLDDKTKNLRLNELFGAYSASVKVLIDQEKLLSENRLKQLNKQGTAARLSKTQMEGIAGAWDRVGGSMSRLTASMGIFTPILIKTLDLMSSFVNTIANVLGTISSEDMTFKNMLPDAQFIKDAIEPINELFANDKEKNKGAGVTWITPEKAQSLRQERLQQMTKTKEITNNFESYVNKGISSNMLSAKSEPQQTEITVKLQSNNPDLKASVAGIKTSSSNMSVKKNITMQNVSNL